MAEYVAAKDVIIGFGDADPERPWRELTESFEAGDLVVRAEELPNLEALVVNGYLKRKEVSGGAE